MESQAHRHGGYEITQKWAILAMLCLSPIFLFSVYLGHPKEGAGIWACAGIVLIALRPHWNSHRSVWFWIVVSTAVLVQVPFVVFIPWNNSDYSSVSLLPMGVLDYGIVYVLVRMMKKKIAVRPGERDPQT
jgi:hypothetical protein